MQSEAVASITAKIKARNRQEADPYMELVLSHQRLQAKSRTAQSEINELNRKLAKERREKTQLEQDCATYKEASASVDVPVANMKKLKQENEDLEKALKSVTSFHELEHRNQALSEENKLLQEQLAKVTSERDELSLRAAERDEMVAILKKELEALKAENTSQQEMFSKSQEENARLTPMVLKLKQREAELMDQIMELETEVCAYRRGEGISGGAPPSKEAQFTTGAVDQGSFGGNACVVPSYIAHQTDDAHEGSIDAVVVTENSRHIWSSGTDKMIRCWESSNGQSVAKVPAIGAVLSLDSVADLMVAGCVDSTCRIYELNTLRGRCQLTGHQEKVTAAYFSTDGQRVFSASSDRTIKSWDVSRGSLTHTSMCFSACNDISVVNDRICSAHFDTTVRFWDARSGKESGDIPNLHERTITSVRLSQDGNTVVSLSRDNSVRVSDVRMMRMLTTLTSEKLQVSRNHARVAISPDASMCAAGSGNGCVLVWKLGDTAATNRPAVLNKGHTGNVPCVTWAPDGRGLVSVGDKRVVLWR